MASIESMLRRRERYPRRGITLLEVIVATTILLGSVMALSRLAFLAGRHAVGSEDRTQAQMLCQNVMQELLAGVRPLETIEPTEMEDVQWVYSVEIERPESSRLVSIAVTVARLDEDDLGLPTAEELNGYRLVRWLRPGKRLSGEGSFPDSFLGGSDSSIGGENWAEDWNGAGASSFIPALGAEPSN